MRDQVGFFATDPSAHLEAVFTQVERTCMAGLPILNTALRVEAIGFTRFEDGWLGVMITPWFMSLLFLPGDEKTALETNQLGDKITHRLPSGSYTFMLSQEDAIGTYLACPLFSPMGQFADQASAREIARTLLEAILDETDLGDSAEAGAEPPSASADGARDRRTQTTANSFSPARRALFRRFFSKKT